MNEHEAGKKITKLLDLGLDDIKQSTLNRLQSARRASLENYHVAESVANVGQGVSARNGNDWHVKSRKLLSIIALLFALAGIFYWQALQQGDENDEIDILVLADDLPINAYLDDGFDAWLDQH
ncbi:MULTISPECIES: DUF3619 family protein [Nitrosospira]|uniref:DUF3619 family protein n=1 Tax=Nitrosospira TaxID=35798 RepID=UPI00046A4760|nr:MULTISPECIES: DUF3619 family protein [Nitrosospira]BCT67493.1 hypothetical protein NNRS527_01078 [Nitrosospira sp. NRS527]